jgi:hypothetical protein
MRLLRDIADRGCIVSKNADYAEKRMLVPISIERIGRVL